MYSIIFLINEYSYQNKLKYFNAGDMPICSMKSVKFINTPKDYNKRLEKIKFKN